MQVLLAGASGLIGSALKRALIDDGHEVRSLVRRPPRDATEAEWAPQRGELDPSHLDGVAAVVCLSGAGIDEHRWTPAFRDTIRDSRTAPVATLARAIAARADRPTVFISGSAIGYYGDTGDQQVDESAPAGNTFIADVCQAWEDASAPAADAGTRVVQLRTGIILARGGPVLVRMVPLFRLGIGGPLGSSRRYWSWVTLVDEVRAIAFLLGADGVSGPVNVTSPHPVTNAEFTRTLGQIVHRPAIVPVPSLALRIVLGGLAEEILRSQRVLPGKLAAAGFEFSYPELAAGMRAELAN